MDAAHDERAHLRARIDRELRRGGFGAWEARFLRDMQNRLGRAGTRLSERQSRKLHEVLSRNRFAPSRRGRPARHHGRFAMRRVTRQRGFSLERQLPLLLVAVLGFALHQTSLRLPAFWQPPPAPAAESLTTARPAETFIIVAGSIRVIDGDTVDVRGEHFRLVGLNTPETYEPRCAAELARGTQAKERLGQLLASGTPQLVKVPCACPPGSEGTQRCNYGRSCGILTVGGHDVAETLIDEGLAVPFHCGTTSCPPLPRPWCS